MWGDEYVILSTYRQFLKYKLLLVNLYCPLRVRNSKDRRSKGDQRVDVTTSYPIIVEKSYHQLPVPWSLSAKLIKIKIATLGLT